MTLVKCQNEKDHCQQDEKNLVYDPKAHDFL